MWLSLYDKERKFCRSLQKKKGIEFMGGLPEDICFLIHWQSYKKMENIISEAEIKGKIAPPKTGRGKRALAKKAPKTFESLKQQVVLRGTKTSPIINDTLHNLVKKFFCVWKGVTRRKKNFLKKNLKIKQKTRKHGPKARNILFIFGNHSKKRPHNLVIGRCFNYQMLDMFEFGIDPKTFKPIKIHKENKKTKIIQKLKDESSIDGGDKSFRVGSKPCLVFQGEAFNNDDRLKKIRNLFMDFYRGDTLLKINLLTVDHVITFTAVSFKSDSLKDAHLEHLGIDEDAMCILIRHYHVELHQSSDPKEPYVHLHEIGPRLDLYSRREEHAPDELQEASRMKPSRTLTNKKPKQKNVKHNILGERVGKLYINRSDQNLAKLKTKKIKALKRNAEDGKKKKTPDSFKKDTD
ncbi:hypothetical protein RFI_00731 [Reticulomyxa filosa]|uniref:Ribosome production factor 2 homolog n=1 Tax=Reticulomyxa filosa TaxID=46433 RepID=X6PE52_RETFI|nr:hypothetical protein RFI_00731 [Reticulomyxa filosa]|eukprot:ETO36334.1 hypothetical protein RFI_00731 [Reticulomyxa filosa]